MKKYNVAPLTDNIQNPYEFNHFSAHSLHNVKWNAKELGKSEISLSNCRRIKRDIDLYDYAAFGDFYIKEEVDDGFFCLSVTWKHSYTGEPCAYCYGCYDENKADKVWEKMLNDNRNKALMVSEVCMKERPKAPFICDVLAKLEYWEVHMMDFKFNGDWTGGFFKFYTLLKFGDYSKLGDNYWLGKME